MQILIQRSDSEPNAIDKTLTTIADLSGDLRDQTSIIDPVIRFSGDLSTVTGANYMTIPAFGRSYFIRNITSVRTGVFDVAAHVDVLSSFKAQIRANSAILRRSEKNWNLYLNDGSLQTYQYPAVLPKKFPYGFPNNKQFILAIAGT